MDNLAVDTFVRVGGIFVRVLARLAGEPDLGGSGGSAPAIGDVPGGMEL